MWAARATSCWGGAAGGEEGPHSLIAQPLDGIESGEAWRAVGCSGGVEVVVVVVVEREIRRKTAARFSKGHV